MITRQGFGDIAAGADGGRCPDGLARACAHYWAGCRRVWFIPWLRLCFDFEPAPLVSGAAPPAPPGGTKGEPPQ